MTKEELAKVIYESIQKHDEVYVGEEPDDYTYVTVDGKVNLVSVAADILAAVNGNGG